MWQEVIYPVAFVLLVLLPAPLLGSYMYRVFEGKSRWLSPIERATLPAAARTDGSRIGSPTPSACWHSTGPVSACCS